MQIEIKNISYNDLHIVSNRHAGMDGFSIRHKDYGTLVTLHYSDTMLLQIIDEALKQATKK